MDAVTTSEKELDYQEKHSNNNDNYDNVLKLTVAFL